MARTFDLFIDCRIDLFVRDISNLLSAPVQKALKRASNRGAFRGGRRLLGRRGNTGYLLAGVNWPTQKLFDCRFHIQW